MADALGQVFRRRKGEDVSIVLTGSDSTDPTTWTLVATIAAGEGAAALLPPITPTVSGTGPYLITIPLTRLQTGTTLAAYSAVHGDLWRTDSGSSECLAAFTLYLDPPVRSPTV